MIGTAQVIIAIIKSLMAIYITRHYILQHKIATKQKPRFRGDAPNRGNKNQPSAFLIKNIIPVVYSECVLKLGDSGHFFSSLRADMSPSATNSTPISY